MLQNVTASHSFDLATGMTCMASYAMRRNEAPCDPLAWKDPRSIRPGPLRWTTNTKAAELWRAHPLLPGNRTRKIAAEEHLRAQLSGLSVWHGRGQWVAAAGEGGVEFGA